MRKTILTVVVVLTVLSISAEECRKGSLLYEADMASAESIACWKMEGPGKIEFKDGWMHMFSPNEEMHHVFWCPQDFPESFVAEWDAQNVETNAGLCIVFFAAQGENGEDVFAPALPKRDGTFKQYIKGKIVSYHISYYANTPPAPDRGDSHLRKNNKFILVQTGPEGIPTRSLDIHKMRVVKNRAHITCFVDDRKIIDWTDDGKTHGRVYGGGKMALRQMQWTHFRYRNFKVWALATD